MDGTTLASRTPLRVFTLACHRDVELATVCLRSFVERCQDPFELTVISDGSLTPEDVDRLRDSLPVFALLESHEALESIVSELREFPCCRKYLEWCPWALKLIAIPLLVKSPFAYFDSDILFLRPFQGFDLRGMASADLAFMFSYANIYSFGWRQALKPGWPRIVRRLNAGFYFARPEAFDLVEVERFLHEGKGHPRAFLLEQTAWGMLAARANSRYFDPQQVAFPQMVLDGRRNLKWKPVAVHFVGGTRHLIPEIQAIDGNVEAGEPVKLKTLPTHRLGRIRLAADLVEHRLRHRWARRSGIFV